jgi:hypothetical protein
MVQQRWKDASVVFEEEKSFLLSSFPSGITNANEIPS